MDTASPRKSRADAHQRILPRRRSADDCSRVKDAVRPAWSIVQLVRASIAVSTEVGRTEDGVTNVLVSKKAQPEKQMNPLIALLRAVRLSLALPSGFAWDAPSLSRHPNDYGMEPASPGRLLFRASAFASAPDVSEHPPQNPVSPARWWSAPRPRRRQWLHHRSPSTGRGGPTIRRHCARRLACRFLHPSIGIDGVHES